MALFCVASAELNWYCVDGKPPAESADFLEDNDAFFVSDTDCKEVFLTFDEGYENGKTADILDTLKEKKVPAAFFVTEPYIRTNPDLIMRMESEGHLVCNHTVHHPSMAQIHNEVKFNEEINGVEVAYNQVTGKTMPKYFRPPMGKYSEESLQRTKNLGYKTIFWSFAYKDWLINEQPDKDFALNKIKKGVFPGCIMLLHAVSDTNAKILPQLIDDMRADGYIFKSLDSLS